MRSISSRLTASARPTITWWARGLLLGLAVAALSLLGFLNWGERWGLTAFFALRGHETFRTPLVIVSIDEDSFDELSLAWPWPRALHAQLLDQIHGGKPAVIGIDLAFSEPSLHGPEDDRLFIEAVERAGNVVLSALATHQEDSHGKGGFHAPIAPLRDRARAVGFVNLRPDSDGVVRSAELTRLVQTHTFPSFAAAVAQEAARAGLPLPIAPAAPSTILINYRTVSLAAQSVPYYRVLRGDIGPDFFAGKIVLIGMSSPRLHGPYSTPLGSAGLTGIEIEAHLVETIMQGLALERVPAVLTVLLVMAAALLATWVTDRLRPQLAAGLLSIVVGLYMLGGFLLFLWPRTVVDLAIVPLTVLLGFGGTILGNSVLAQRQRAALKQLFSRHISPEIANTIWQERERFLTGGPLQSQKLTATVLFTDLRGFTALSERMDTSALINWVNDYMESMARLVMRHGGMVEDYFGDAIKADFGAPFARTSEEDIRMDTIHAVECALAMGEALHGLNRRWQDQGLPIVDMRVGICTGEVVAGCVGSDQRLKFTTMGDVVNAAARLESYEKGGDDPSLTPGSCRILIAESTAAYLSSRFRLHRVGNLSGPGKEPMIGVYRVYGRHEPRLSTATGVELRTTHRVEWAAPITLTHPAQHPAVSHNLSLGGIAIGRLTVPLPVGTLSTLRFEIPGQGQSIQATGMVVWTQGERAGIAFSSLPPSDQLMLEQFLHQRAARRAAEHSPAPFPTVLSSRARTSSSRSPGMSSTAHLCAGFTRITNRCSTSHLRTDTEAPATYWYWRNHGMQRWTSADSVEIQVSRRRLDSTHSGIQQTPDASYLQHLDWNPRQSRS